MSTEVVVCVSDISGTNGITTISPPKSGMHLVGYQLIHNVDKYNLRLLTLWSETAPATMLALKLLQSP